MSVRNAGIGPPPVSARIATTQWRGSLGLIMGKKADKLQRTFEHRLEEISEQFDEVLALVQPEGEPLAEERAAFEASARSVRERMVEVQAEVDQSRIAIGMARRLARTGPRLEAEVRARCRDRCAECRLAGGVRVVVGGVREQRAADRRGDRALVDRGERSRRRCVAGRSTSTRMWSASRSRAGRRRSSPPPIGRRRSWPGGADGGRGAGARSVS